MEPHTLFLFAFFVFTIGHLVGEVFILKNNKVGKTIRYATKPLLMPLLTLYYLFGAPYVNGWLVAGILGGFVGDICLMIPDPNETKRFFRLGLIAFLLGHVFYVMAFIQAAGDFDGYQWWSIFLAIPYIAIGAYTYPRLIKHTGKMAIPVTIYLIVIVLMGVSTSLLWGIRAPIGVGIAMIGALVFMISDTINAFNRFAKQIPNERLYTMSTYLIGQFLLVFGYILAVSI
ncbi:MAG: lysoplasmalogenase [Promethearchaeota archaeon]